MIDPFTRFTNSSITPPIPATSTQALERSKDEHQSYIMSGIPVYTKSPINASKTSGVAPQAADPQAQSSPLTPNPAPAATTTSTSTYPPARPGAVAFSGPTAAAQRYAPHVQPTPTTQIGDENAPAPQPGSVPAPSSRNTIPPPPKTGESHRQPYPPQMAIPPPTGPYRSQHPSSSTSTTTSASASYPVAIPSAEVPRRSLEHPPGYQQNVYASEPTSGYQKRAQEANASLLGAQDASDNMGGMDFLNTAKKWAQQAGEKISEVEAEVWRKINKE